MPSSAGQSSPLDPRNLLLDLPPGSYHSGEEDPDVDQLFSDSESSVLAYDEAPEYLKRRSNKEAPIVIESSDDEEHYGHPIHVPGPFAERKQDDNAEGYEEEDNLWLGLDEVFDAIKKRQHEEEKGEEEDPRRSRRRLSDPHGLLPEQSVPQVSKNHQPAHASPLAQPFDGLFTLNRVHQPNRSVQPDPPGHLAQVLEILPDIEVDWANQLIAAEVTAGRTDNISQRVVGMALETDGGYPKASTKKKQNQNVTVEEGEGEAYRSLDHKKTERVGNVYFQRSTLQLEEDFPSIPVPHIRTTFYSLDYLYVPTYYRLLEQTRENPKPYQELKRPRVAGKGKNKDGASAKSLPISISDVFQNTEDVNANDFEGTKAFERELEWLRAIIARERAAKGEEEAKRLAHEISLASGEGIECGCCFGEEVWSEMFQCSDGHLFCRDCATKHAETKLGEQLTSINCMDMSGCHSPFVEAELARLLPTKSLSLYHRLKQAKELEQAEIEGLESCPSCPYAAVIENPDEKLFVCLNDECGQVTCRSCRRKEHIPRTCAEVEADLKLNNRHTVEDAMSEALIRKCPKCAKPYVKETGCNKIMCTKCNTLSCYICQKAISGYDHFNSNSQTYGQPKRAGECVLWDNAERQNDEAAIRNARDAAQMRVRAAARAAGLELAEDDLNVDFPEAQVQAAAPGLIVPHPPRRLERPAARVPQVLPGVEEIPGQPGLYRVNGRLVYAPPHLPPPVPPPPPVIAPLPARFRQLPGGMNENEPNRLNIEAAQEEGEIRRLLIERNPPGENRIWRRNANEMPGPVPGLPPVPVQGVAVGRVPPPAPPIEGVRPGRRGGR